MRGEKTKVQRAKENHPVPQSPYINGGLNRRQNNLFREEQQEKGGGSNRERNSWDPSFLGSYFSLKKIGLIGRSRRCHRLAQKSAIKATCSGGKVHLKTGSKDSWWGEKSVFLFCITIFLSLYSTYQQLES